MAFHTMQDNNDIVQRLSYSPSEFARACGKHPSWGYRQLYAGKVKALTGYGRLAIPASEISRIMATAATYNPKSRHPIKESQKVDA